MKSKAKTARILLTMVMGTSLASCSLFQTSESTGDGPSSEGETSVSTGENHQSQSDIHEDSSLAGDSGIHGGSSVGNDSLGGTPSGITYDDHAETIEWKAVSGASYYLITITSKEGGTVYVNEERADGTSFVYVSTGDGFTVKVVPVGKNGTKGEASTCSFTHILPPTLESINYDYGVFTWDPIANATGYEITFAGDVTKTDTTVEPTYSLYEEGNGLDDLDFNVTIWPLFDDDTFYSSASDEYPVHAVSMSSINFSKAGPGENPTFSWTAAPNASGYSVKITKEGNPLPLREDNLSPVATEYSAYDFLEAGVYHVYIAAKGDETKNLVSSPYRHLTIRRLETPVIDLNSMTSDDKTHSFAWDPVEGAEGYTVSKDGVNLGNKGQNTSYQASNENPETGLQEETFEYTVQATSTDAYTLDSAISEGVRFMVLPRVQELRCVNGNVEWDSITDASGYEVSIDGVASEVVTSTFELPRLNEGTHTVTVRALGNGKDIITSPYAAELSVRKLPAPSNVRISDDHLITWDAVEGATSYSVYVNAGSNPISVIDNSVELPTIDGSTSITVVARGNGGDVFDSELSTPLQLYKLPAPLNLRVQDNNIVWDAVDFADSYELTIQNTIRRTSGTSMSLEDFPAGTYQVTVKAIGVNSYYDSEATQAVVITKLADPSGVKATPEGIVWNGVSQAQEYDLYLDGTHVATVANTIRYYMPTDLEAGEHTFQVRAMGNDAANIISSSFTTYTWNVKKLSPITSASTTGIDDNGLGIKISNLDAAASGYAVYIDGVQAGSPIMRDEDGLISMECRVTNPGAGQHTITARALGDGVTSVDSEISEATSFDVLSAPRNIRINQDYPGAEMVDILWDVVTGADYYTVELTKTNTLTGETSVLGPLEVVSPTLRVFIEGFNKIDVSIGACSGNENAVNSTISHETFRL